MVMAVQVFHFKNHSLMLRHLFPIFCHFKLSAVNVLPVNLHPDFWDLEGSFLDQGGKKIPSFFLHMCNWGSRDTMLLSFMPAYGAFTEKIKWSEIFVLNWKSAWNKKAEIWCLGFTTARALDCDLGQVPLTPSASVVKIIILNLSLYRRKAAEK